MPEGWHVRNETELKALVEHCEKRLAKGESLSFWVKREDTRTDRQNRALWQAMTMLAEALNDAGFDMKKFPFKEGIDIPWDKEDVKKRLFDPVMGAVTGKDSSKKLKRAEVSQIWDILIRHLGQVTGVSFPFPSWEHFHEKQGVRTKRD